MMREPTESNGAVKDAARSEAAERELQDAWSELRADAREFGAGFAALGRVHLSRLGLSARRALFTGASAVLGLVALLFLVAASTLSLLRGLSLAVVRLTGEEWAGPLGSAIIGLALAAGLLAVARRRADRRHSRRLAERLAVDEAAADLSERPS